MHHFVASMFYFYYQRKVLGILALSGFAFFYLAGQLFGNDGIEYLFADVDWEALHVAGHIFVYGFLAVLLARAIGNRWVLAWLISNVLAAGEEYHQLIVPGRVACVEDALLNLASITVFLALACLLQSLLRNRFRAAASKLINTPSRTATRSSTGVFLGQTPVLEYSDQANRGIMVSESSYK